MVLEAARFWLKSVDALRRGGAPPSAPASRLGSAPYDGDLGPGGAAPWLSADEFVAQALECFAADDCTGPTADRFREDAGLAGEFLLQARLEALGLSFARHFITESELRQRDDFSHTPDFLFRVPVAINGFEVMWVDSKACFGSEDQLVADFNGQLHKYTELIGGFPLCARPGLWVC